MKSFLLCTLIIPTLLLSQEHSKPVYTVSGKIIDASTKMPLEYATVLFKNLDSVGVEFGGISNKKGGFTIELEQGNYTTSIDFLSYKSKIIKLQLENKNIDLGIIPLEVDTQFLEKVEVIGRKKLVVFKPKKIVYNVSRDIAAAGGMATAVLNNIPSVDVSFVNGKITYRGQDVTVLLNGKISSLTKADAIKSLPAGTIERIELISNPSASYRATSKSIINIILKKGKNEGFNASITASGGYKDYFGGLVTLNHKSKHINLYTTTSYFYRNPILLAHKETEYFDSGATTGFINESSENNGLGKGWVSTIGADFDLSTKTSLTASMNYQNLKNDHITLTKTDFFDGVNLPTETNNRTRILDFKNHVLEFIVDFEHRFQKEGSMLNSYFVYTKDTDDFYNKISNTNDAFTDEENVEINRLENFMIDLQYTNPINKKLSYSLGYSGEFGKIPFTYTGTLATEAVDYSENIHAAFIESEYQSEKFYLGIGLRGEFTESKINYIHLNSTQTKYFNDVLPSFSTDYSFNEQHNLSFSYGKSIYRPSYLQLRPFELKVSETTTYIGNVDLNPIYIDSFDLTYKFSAQKINFISSLYYTMYMDWWEQITYETEEQINGFNKIITTPVNIGKVNYLGLNLTSIYMPSKNLSFTGNIALMQVSQTGVYEIVNSINNNGIKDYNHQNFDSTYSLLCQVNIPTILNFQTTIKHYSISKLAYTTFQPNTYITASINKELLRNKATISLTVDDLFKSNKINRARFDDGYFSEASIASKYRKIIVSFIYRFNQSKKDRKVDFSRKEDRPDY